MAKTFLFLRYLQLAKPTIKWHTAKKWNYKRNKFISSYYPTKRFQGYIQLAKPIKKIIWNKEKRIGKDDKSLLGLVKPFKWWNQVKIMGDAIRPEQSRIPKKFAKLVPEKTFRTIYQGIDHKKKYKLKARVFKRTIFLNSWKPGRSRKWYYRFPRQVAKMLPNSSEDFKFGRIYITYKHNNTFMTVTTQNPSNVLCVMNAGQSGYRGPKRSTTVAREAVARETAERAVSLNIRVVDLYFNIIGKVYWYIIKGLMEKEIFVRALILKKPKPHGYIRPKKERRL